MKTNWISLADYSAKFKTSISTLRRRIKKEEIQYVMDNGKYFLPDLDTQAITSKKSFSPAPPTPKAESYGQHFAGKDFLDLSEDFMPTKKNAEFNAQVNYLDDESDQDNFSGRKSVQKENIQEHPGRFQLQNMIAPLLDQMNKELKKAYSATLQEKEEQIIILKEQVADLKTLVNILESENKRLNQSDYFNPDNILDSNSF